MQAETPDSRDLCRRAQEATQRWLNDVIIGLGLCPFAAPAIARGKVRIRVASGAQPARWLDVVTEEALGLAGADERGPETVLVVLPEADEDFLVFNDFLDPLEDRLAELSLDDTLQIAVFHPAFRFAGLPDADSRHRIHRAPFPTVHLLLAQSLDVEQAVVDAILERNERTVASLGPDDWPPI